MEPLKSTPGNSTRPDPPFLQRSKPGAIPLQSKQDCAFFRKLIHVKDGRRIMLRFLEEGDRQDLIKLFQDASWEDLAFFRHNLQNRSLLNFWLNHVDYRRLSPLVAINLEDNRLVAAATLLRGKNTAQHIGEIKIFISGAFRNLGLGSRILDELIEVAKRENLHWLKAELVADQKQVVKALRNKGFRIRATLEDFFMSRDGETHDVLLMMLSPQKTGQETF